MSDEQDFQIMNTRMRWLLLFALWLPGAQGAELLGGEFAHLLDEEPAFLKVDQAFVLDATLAEDGSLLANWTIADGYYLYRHQFGFDARPDGAIALSEFEIGPGKIKVDEYFGEVEVYYHDARVRVPLRSTADPAEPFEVGVSYQGCADRGLCYPPETRWIRFAGVPGLVAGDNSGSGKGGSSSVAVVTQERSLADLLSQGTLFGALLLFFIGGVGLAFTPCVLPMVPILSSIIVGESDSLTRTRAFTLSLSYVLGMAVTYAVLGVVV
jgi:thiol:disulfide interchange protein DsbD